MSANNAIVLSSDEWNTSAIKYMKPKVMERGSKSVSIISKQTNRKLHISTPLMMTWGISDFTDDKGDSNGKYTMQLCFPNSEYSNDHTQTFLQKLQAFEEQILDDAAKLSSDWWGNQMSRDICKFTMYPILKKNRDPSKPPSLSVKVPCYNGKWNVEIYDTRDNLLFPAADDAKTPIDFVPKMSSVACVIVCNGIWIGGKGWGCSWVLHQCIVKPREMLSIRGCAVRLTAEERGVLEKQEIPAAGSASAPPALEYEEDEEPVSRKPAAAPPKQEEKPIQTEVEDSDDEEGEVSTNEAAAYIEPAVVEEPVMPPPVPVAAPAAAPVKKVIKKAVVEPEKPAEVPATAPVSGAPEAPVVSSETKKKVIAKKK